MLLPQTTKVLYYSQFCCNLVISRVSYYSILLVCEASFHQLSLVTCINTQLVSVSQGDLIKVSELQVEIANLKKGDSTMIEYFIELTMLWEQLDNYQPMPQFMSCLVYL